MDSADRPRKKILPGNTLTGILLLVVGGALLLRQSGYPLPSWLFTWPVLVIVIGLFVGVRNGFRDYSGPITIFVGSVFLLDNIYPSLQVKHYAIPGIVIFLGLIFIFAPRGKRVCQGNAGSRIRNRAVDAGGQNLMTEGPVNEDLSARNYRDTVKGTAESTVDIVSVFSGVKKKILSKNFFGGEVVCIFGGSEINLTNADFVSPVTIEFVQIFGGTKLIVPANWEVRSEVAAIFGGIEDKRLQPANSVADKTIILNGTVIFGGVEVSSF